MAESLDLPGRRPAPDRGETDCRPDSHQSLLLASGMPARPSTPPPGSVRPASWAITLSSGCRNYASRF